MYDANFVLKSSGAETASTNSSGVDLGTAIRSSGLWARINVTAVSGTSPTMTVAFQNSSDNSSFATVAQSQQITAVGVYFVLVGSDSRYLRSASTIGGTTPSFTYKVDLGLSHP